ncbi:MAG: LLM class flavin-dependent oxidoreductase [Hyphomicrobiaceae bacterium]|nr:LLM class flavin-dependent oxidoreductase [Hyphomicrobiaceae bacterium]
MAAVPFKLSILDQSIASVGKPQGEAIRNAIALAKSTEKMGYARFWVSEHHNNDTIVGSAPEILMAAIASQTTKIRVGSAGVMLPHYAPYKVAEQFRVLEAIAPGRIDLGLGRAPGSDGRTAWALNARANERADEFPSDIQDLQDWLANRPLREGHPFRGVRAFPAGDTTPEMWVLGSSNYGAQVAAHFGLPYAFAYFFTDGQGTKDALHFYNSTYKASLRHSKPYSALCVWALAADTAEEAAFQFGPRAHFRLHRDRGIFLPLENPETLAKHNYTTEDRGRLKTFHDKAFIGTGADVKARIDALVAETGVDEIVIVTWAYEEQARHKSYQLIAEAYGLDS